MNKAILTRNISLGVGGKSSLTRFVRITALTLGFSVAPVFAVDGTWNVTTGVGSWGTPASWVGSPSPVPGGATSTVNLTAGSTATKDVNLDGDRTVGILNLGSTGVYRVNSGTGGSLTFDNGVSNAQLNYDGTYSLTIHAPVFLTSSLDINSGASTNGKGFNGGVTASGTGAKVMTFSGTGTGDLTISSKISDGGSATLSIRQNSSTGGMILRNSNANSFSGGVRVSSGTLTATNSDNKVFGTGTISLEGGTLKTSQFSSFNYGNAVVVSADSSLIANRSSGNNAQITHTFGSLNIGNNTLSVNNLGTSSTVFEDVLAFGATTLSGNATFSVQTVGGTNSRLKLGALNGTSNLTKTGNGILELSTAAGTYSGTTTLNAGTMIVGHNSALGTGRVVISGTSAATLQIGTGILTANNVTYSNTNATSSIQRVVSGSSSFNVGTSGALTSDFVGGTDNTTAALRAGSGATTLTMSFAPTATASNDGSRVSDVFNLSLSTSQTFVLQLSTGVSGSDPLYLGWLDGGAWVEATTGNTGAGGLAGQYHSTWDAFLAGNGGTFNATTMLGAYGYDETTSTAWAVLNHNSEYALVVPEPSTVVLCGLGLSFMLFRLRPRRQLS